MAEAWSVEVRVVRQHAAADVAHLGLAGREVGTMELLALGRVPRQGGGGGYNNT